MFFSIYTHRYYANLWKHECLGIQWSGQYGRGKVNRSWPTHYDIDKKPTHGLENYIDLLQWMLINI